MEVRMGIGRMAKKREEGVMRRHGLWVSHFYPAFSRLRVDYVLGNLESKSMWTPPNFLAPPFL
jgi:hypothetical protein